MDHDAEPDAPPPRRLPPISRARIVELAVVVFGVLIALALENVVQELRWRSEARELEALFAVDLRHNLAAAVERRASDPCLAGRVAELAERVGAANGSLPGAAIPSPDGANRVAAAYTAPIRTWWTSSFDRALGSEAVKRIPHDRFVTYGVLFGWVDRIRDLQAAEAEATARLAPLAYDQADFNGEVRAQALADLALADSYRWRLASAAGQFIRNSAASGVAPSRSQVEATQVGPAPDETLARMLQRLRERRGACVDAAGALRLLDPP